MDKLFCYGTLMYHPLLRALLGVEPEWQEASLADFACYGMRGESYPAIVPEEGGLVAGQLVTHVPAKAWLVLDRYEGEYYHRETVKVLCADGSEMDAAAYVLRPRFASRLSRKAWHYNRDAERYAKAQRDALQKQAG